jgi:hypothetical protein
MHNKSKEIPEYLIVKNPYNGEHVDMLPFFTIIEEAKLRGVSLVEQMQEVHDFISTVYIEKESRLTHESLAQLCSICMEVRDTFKTVKVL